MSTEKGRSRNVQNTDQQSLEELIRAVTFTFAKDGLKLIFIDNQVSLSAIATENEGRSSSLCTIPLQSKIVISRYASHSLSTLTRRSV
jgi:hypothetical protein